MAEQLANLAKSTLNGAIIAGATSITLTDASSFPSSGNFRITIDQDGAAPEIALCTSRSGNVLTVTRGQEGTAAAGFADGTTVTHALTKAALENVIDERAELAYVEFTAPVTVSATVEGTPNDVVSAGALTFDGSTRAKIEFFAPRVDAGSTAGSWVVCNLWDDATDLGRIANFSLASVIAPAKGERYLTPTNGSHTYKIRAWRINSNGAISAGAGGAGATMPGFIRVTRA